MSKQGARMGGIGAICGFFVGQVDLVHIFPYLGQTQVRGQALHRLSSALADQLNHRCPLPQLQILSVLGGIVLLATHGVTMLCVREVPLETPDLRYDMIFKRGGATENKSVHTHAGNVETAAPTETGCRAPLGASPRCRRRSPTSPGRYVSW